MLYLLSVKGVRILLAVDLHAEGTILALQIKASEVRFRTWICDFRILQEKDKTAPSQSILRSYHIFKPGEEESHGGQRLPDRS